MGQHRRDIQRIYQRPEKNSQSAFRQNPHDALQTQGSGLAMSRLWDGSVKYHDVVALSGHFLATFAYIGSILKVFKKSSPGINFACRWDTILVLKLYVRNIMAGCRKKALYNL
jgi:hypothetical protein